VPPLARRAVRRSAAPLGDLGDPIVSELFSVERLEQHARTLAAAQAITMDPRRGHSIGPRIVDNFHIVDEQLREIRDDLPADYYHELPKLAEGHLEGYPRVVGLAWAYVAHTDSRFDPDSLRRMVEAYQEVELLTIGELWAIAISLRIVLVENLRRLAAELVASRAARQRADEFADSLLGLGGDDPAAAAASIRRLTDATLTTAGRVQLFQRLRDQDPAATPALGWLEERLIAQGTTAEETVRLEHQRQAAMNVTVRNVITSMRLISWFDWATFVEDVSLVDVVLRSRPSFGAMDFATRDRYRHAVEVLARRSGETEVAVARAALERADRGRQDEQVDGPPAVPAATPDGGHPAEPGYYLIGDGRAEFEEALGVRMPFARRFRRAFAASPAGYVGSVAFATVLVAAVPILLAGWLGASGPALALISILALFPASDLAVALVNRTVTDALGPRALPRFELAQGVPDHLRTLVVVPTLLASTADVEEQVARLEIHYLGNPEGDLRFALLSDWLDAQTESAPGDDELLSTAAAAIDRLNARHGDAPGGGARFVARLPAA
jgi:cyclic beta-1,2-glucan synthetase